MSNWNGYGYGNLPHNPNLPPQPRNGRGGGHLGRPYKRHNNPQQHMQHAQPLPPHMMNAQAGPAPYYVDSYAAVDGPSLKRPRIDGHNYYQQPPGMRGGPNYRYNNRNQQVGPPMPNQQMQMGGMMPNHGGNGYKGMNNGMGMMGQQGMMGGPMIQGGLQQQGQQQGQQIRQPKRVYSDFRISKVRIGTFEVTETKFDSSSRDSRLRLYFRNSGDISHGHNNPNLSARERALLEPDRLSISVYQGTKRIVIPVQDGLDKVRFNRKEGYFHISSQAWALFEEIQTGGNNGGGKMPAFTKCDDITNGQLAASDGVIEVWIDKQNPLPMEPKWTRGNIQDYIDPRSKFRTQGVLVVDDPENINSFDAIVGLWTRESSIDTQQERIQFSSTQLVKLEYLLELASKILAPPYYYVSKSGHNPQTIQLVESGQITALISPSVNALLATLVKFSILAKLPDDQVIAQIKEVLFRVPEPIIWRALDGLFGKRTEPLNFDASKILDQTGSDSKDEDPTTTSLEPALENSKITDNDESMKYDQEAEDEFRFSLSPDAQNE